MIAFLVALLLGTGPPPSAGSELIFHGWSPDSRLVAYTRLRGGKDRSDQRVHRFVKDGEFAGFGRKVGADVATYARDRGYVTTPLPRRQTGRTSFELQAGGRVLTLVFDVGAAVSWRLLDGPELVARHTFDRIYIGFEPELYPAPDASQGVLVMHLDTGWETDAAIFPVRLPR